MRFHVVKGHIAATILLIIESHVKIDSYVVSDLWRAYCRLNESGYCHRTVNRSKNFINLTTGFHTQAIKRAWVDAKSWIKRSRGASLLLQSDLDEFSWRKLRGQ